MQETETTDTDAVKINLGTADKFALLGASGITNVSAHIFIIGDVGSSPTPTVTGIKPSQVKGHLYLKSTPVTAGAQRGLTVHTIRRRAPRVAPTLPARIWAE
jgi:hypothetical protein